VAFPQSEEQVAGVLALAHREGWSVVPWGSGHSRAGGSAPARYDVALVLTGLGRVLDHDSENLTVTAQAGASLSDVNRQARPRHQFLPLGFGHERRTLGGLVAANRTPPQRLVHGDLRDQVLGLRVATADGTLVRYGRKVLKNVAGYDMNKLFVGSEGLLGVIVELTFKLAALPDETACLLGTFPAAPDGFACAAALFRSALLPSGLFLLDAAAGAALRKGQGLPLREGAAHLLIGFAGRGVTVKRQLADGRALLTQHGATADDTFAALSEAAATALEAPGGTAPDAPSGPAPHPGVLLRLGLRATDLPAAWSRAGEDLASGGAEAKVADYGAGRLLVALPAPADAVPFAGRVAALRTRLAARRGYAVLERAPVAVRALVPAWGDLGGELSLLRALKTQLDPQGILAPGRFF
jgi:glycolate oxidase FAD binding subunit